MKLDFCCVCGTKEDLQQHHLEPVVFTGAKRKSKKYDPNKQLKDCDSFELFACLFNKGFISDDATLTVCSFHHNILHGVVKFQKNLHSEMIKEGLDKVRNSGVKLGRPSNITDNTKKQVVILRKGGQGPKQICKALKIGCGTYYKIIEEYDINNSTNLKHSWKAIT